MDLDKALGILLDDDADVVAIAGENIFSEELPQGKESGGAVGQPYPGISYRPPAPPERGKQVIRTLQGGCTLVEEIRYVYSAAKNKTVASNLDQAIFNALDEFAGTVSDEASPPSTLDIQGIFATDVAHVYVGRDQVTETASATGVYHYVTRYRIVYSVTTQLNKNSAP